MSFKSEVTYKINLVDVFNRVYKDKSFEYRKQLRPLLKTSVFKSLYGEYVIDKILQRTEEKHIDRNGALFKKYSEQYAKKNNKNVYEVNLRLTGKMLDSIRSKSSGDNVNISPSEKESGKAHGHVFGGGKLPKRDFLGLPIKDENDIMKKVFKDITRG